MSESPPPSLPPSPAGPPPRASFRETASAVFWSFFGVRKRRAGERDRLSLNPVHVVIMGVIGGIVFVATLLVIVNLIVRKG